MGASASPLRDAAILELDPNTIDIDVTGRIGFFFPDKAAAFGRIMRKDGQQDLVKVSRLPAGGEYAWRLHVGLHRTVGARGEGLPIYAIEVSGSPEWLAQLESTENLIRRVVEPIERAKFVGAYCEAVQSRHAREHGNLTQYQRAAKARWSGARNHKATTETAIQQEVNDASATMALAYGWVESAMDAFGFGKRSIHRSLKIYRQVVAPFPADLVRKLADQPAGKEQKQLLDLASIEREELRLQAIEAVVADPELSVLSAMQLVGIPTAGGSEHPAVGHQKYYDQISGGWERLGLPQKRDFIPTLASMLNTPGLKRAMRDRLNEELGDV